MYIRKNAAVIEGWLNYKLVEYIQKRNPNVPAIPFKLFPPTDKDRNLTEATKFWNAVHTQMPLYDLYNGKEFNDDNYKLYGQMSIDHFIPWSFVLHNEIWNLYPSFKNINSGKNDRLPDKRRYLNEFCEAQFKGFMIARKINSLKKAMEEYLTVSRDIFELEESDRSHDAFVKSMKQTIEPLYQIANNQGYGVWWLENSKQD